MKTLSQVKVKMLDIEKKEFVERTIDISNICVPVNGVMEIVKNSAKQSKLLKKWVRERAEAQHQAKLELIDWVLV